MKLIEQDFATEERQKRLRDLQDARVIDNRLGEIIDEIFLGTDKVLEGAMQ